MTSPPLNQVQLRKVFAEFGSNFTLPSAAYTSLEVYAWEQENLWQSTWVCVGRLDDLLAPRQVRAIDVGRESVLLVRDEEGTLRAFSNVCRHRGHELAPVGDAIEVRLIRCPYHSWSYRFDGTLRAAPTFTQGQRFDASEFPLISLGVDVMGGWVFVDLSGSSMSLGTHFGNLAEIISPYEPERLVTAASHSYEVQANWKIIVENYNECYHCSTIHPELCQVTPPDSGVDHIPTGMWLGGTMDLKEHAVTMSLDGSSNGVNFRKIDHETTRQVWYVTVTPNLLLSLHPDYVMTHRLTPMDVDRTFVECAWLFSPEAFDLPGFDPSYATDFWDLTNREDWSACEGVQRGMRNRGYRPGPLSSWEGTVYQFLGVMARFYLGEGLVVPTVPQRELH
ncbi:MAG TPA: aromatic ring-hydroxylating dioxygenase subunit alpha [Acidimicrobiia bacterium]|nr:aromatic ring-hydroxylating dioxygenase subunit alpha [Acidimicrobiia bacterium]HLF59728.1 aromatic ring-hydroxylating dioxygenase subunit alpha [Acidimicrobiia bacterium]